MDNNTMINDVLAAYDSLGKAIRSLANNIKQSEPELRDCSVAVWGVLSSNPDCVFSTDAMAIRLGDAYSPVEILTACNKLSEAGLITKVLNGFVCRGLPKLRGLQPQMPMTPTCRSPYI